jgi:hypothetical protein
MINFNQVLQYIKGRLALPSTFIEKTDTEMTDWIINVTLPDFSNYYPDIEWTSVLIDNVNYAVPGKTYHYRFFDEEDLPIYDIRQCYFSLSNDYITGWPALPALSFEGMKWWALDVFKSKMFKPFSQWNKTYRFIPQNIVRVLPDVTENFVVEYEREQPHDLRKVPAAMKRMFMDLCLADIMVWIGGIRTHYGGGRLTTPFGEIPLEGDTLKSEGQELRRELIEKMIDDTIPPVIIDIG